MIYVRTECKGIQRWILATTKLADLQGGSARVEGLQQLVSERAQATGGEILINAAGGATLRFAQERGAQDFVRDWPLRVEAHLPGIELVTAWSRRLDALFERAGEARHQPPNPLTEYGPGVVRAGLSGLPAVRKIGGEWVDAAMQARRAEEVDEALLRRVWPEAPELELDLHQWGDEERVAWIHADGNRVGQAMQREAAKFKDETAAWQAQKALSERLRQAAETATARVVQQLHHEYRETRTKLPLRPIVVGGDDLTLLVPACYGLESAALWLQVFQAKSGFKACAGVALVKASYPFRRAYELAEALCQHAKASLDGETGLAFQRVTTALPEDPGQQLAFTLPKLGELDQDRLHLRRLPRGKLRRLALHDEPALRQRIEQVAGDDRDQALAWEALKKREPAWLQAALTWQTVHPTGQTNLFPGTLKEGT